MGWVPGRAVICSVGQVVIVHMDIALGIEHLGIMELKPRTRNPQNLVWLSVFCGKNVVVSRLSYRYVSIFAKFTGGVHLACRAAKVRRLFVAEDPHTVTYR